MKINKLSINKNQIRQTALPIIAAMIWGTAFVAQSVSTQLIGAFTFNSSRAFIAFVFLGIVLLVLKLVNKKDNDERTEEEKRLSKRNLIIGGILSGLFLSIATNLQQFALADTNAGKAAFITALYIVIVPIIGVLFKKKLPVKIILAVILALGGLYLLCIKEGFSIGSSDIILLLCAVAFAAQIMTVDHFGVNVNGIMLSAVQFLTMGILSGICALIFESPSISQLVDCAIPILYVGVLSSGVAYTLQIIAQKDANPTVVSLLLSLESVFGAISSALILPDSIMSLREYLGCLLMFIAVVFSQLPIEIKKKKKSTIT